MLGVVDPVLAGELALPSLIGEALSLSFLVTASLVVRIPEILGFCDEKKGSLGLVVERCGAGPSRVVSGFGLELRASEDAL